MTVSDSLLILAWIAILLLVLAVSGLIRQIRVLARRMNDPVIRRGNLFQIGDLLPATIDNRLYVFMNSACKACISTASVLRAQAELIGRLEQGSDVVAVFSGDAHEGLDLPPAVATFVDREDLFEAFRVAVTPFVVLYSREKGAIVSTPIGKRREMLAVLDQLVLESSSVATANGQPSSHPRVASERIEA